MKTKRRRPLRPIHARIKQLRLKRGLSQQALAKKCGLDKTTVSHWERGKSAPRWWLEPKVAAALDVTVDELNEAA